MHSFYHLFSFLPLLGFFYLELPGFTLYLVLRPLYPCKEPRTHLLGSRIKKLLELVRELITYLPTLMSANRSLHSDQESLVFHSMLPMVLYVQV